MRRAPAWKDAGCGSPYFTGVAGQVNRNDLTVTIGNIAFGERLGGRSGHVRVVPVGPRREKIPRFKRRLTVAVDVDRNAVKGFGQMRSSSRDGKATRREENPVEPLAFQLPRDAFDLKRLIHDVPALMRTWPSEPETAQRCRRGGCPGIERPSCHRQPFAGLQHTQTVWLRLNREIGRNTMARFPRQRLACFTARFACAATHETPFVPLATESAGTRACARRTLSERVAVRSHHELHQQRRWISNKHQRNTAGKGRPTAAFCGSPTPARHPVPSARNVFDIASLLGVWRGLGGGMDDLAFTVWHFNGVGQQQTCRWRTAFGGIIEACHARRRSAQATHVAALQIQCEHDERDQEGTQGRPKSAVKWRPEGRLHRLRP